METSEWASSCDPKAMLAFLTERQLHGALLRFAAVNCRRVRDQLPGRVFIDALQRTEELAAGLATWSMVDDALATASIKLDKLVAKYRDMDEGEEYDRLGRKIGAAEVLFAFQYQGADEVAGAVSASFLERAEDRKAEEKRQADLLREIVPDPLTVLNADEQYEQDQP